jgi:hypothetical protein
MTDQQPDPEVPEGRRERLASRRRRRTKIVVTVVTVIAIGGVATVSAIALSDKDAAPGVTSVTTNPKLAAIGQLPDGPKVPTGQPLRALDHDHPLRLWIGGDSLAGSFGPTLGDMLDATGIVQTRVDYKVSSGLWSNDIRDWQARAESQMASDNPEAVVFIIGTNDTPVVNNVDRNNDGEPDWETSYRQKVDKMMDTFVGTGPTPRTVYWLGAPTLGTESMNRGAKAIDALVSAEALKRGTKVIFVDTYRLFSDSQGGYSRDIVDDKGQTIEARISDGVHFTADGAAYLAREVFGLLDARWKLTKQADPAQPYHWSLAYGSGESVPGYHYHYSNYSSSQQSSGSTTSPPTSSAAASSTLPATSVPKTAAPVTTAAPVSTPPTTEAPPTTITKPGKKP